MTPSRLFLSRTLLPFFAVALAAVLGLPGLARAESKSIAGCWQIEISLPFPMSNKKLNACFEQQGNKLTGKVRKTEKDPWKPMSNALQNGDTVSFVLKGEKGQLKFEGSLESDARMKGKLKTPKGERPFHGKRAAR